MQEKCVSLQHGIVGLLRALGKSSNLPKMTKTKRQSADEGSQERDGESKIILIAYLESDASLQLGNQQDVGGSDSG